MDRFGGVPTEGDEGPPGQGPVGPTYCHHGLARAGRTPPDRAPGSARAGRPDRAGRPSIRILLVGHSPPEEQLLQEMAGRPDAPTFEWAQVETMDLALVRVSVRTPDVLLIRLSRDGDEMDAVHELVSQHPSVSVVTIVAPDAGDQGLASIRSGAQDYLVSGRADAERLHQVFLTTVERTRLWSALRATALVDELTGLYNRRGFFTLARQQLRLAQRAGLDATLLFADIDNMKQINDTLGHRFGDMALIETADYLRGSFREADLIGRIGGDEFVVLALESADSPVEGLVSRLEQRLDERRPLGGFYELRLSIGRAEFSPDSPSPIEALLATADFAMYERKHALRTDEILDRVVERLDRIA